MSQDNKVITYKDAGVNIDAGDEFVDTITPLIQKTIRPEVISSLGGYAGLFQLDLSKYKNPVLVSGTDGVGTKLKIAIDLKKYDTIGIDLVAMCVNDILCCGAEPLFFLDYFATGLLEPGVGSEIVKGMASCLADINCSLMGGETAEMPGLYQKGEFDLAGFAVGVVDKNKILDGSQVKEGDTLIAVASSGVHSNGFSLVRKILEAKKIALTDKVEGLNQPIGYELLTPTRIYVNPALKLLSQNLAHGIAHITGGGIVENVPRILPKGLKASFIKKDIRVPQIFKRLQTWGNVPEDEMWRVFNMGVGLVVVVSPGEAAKALDILNRDGFESYTVGKITRHFPGEKEVELA